MDGTAVSSNAVLEEESTDATLLNLASGREGAEEAGNG